MKQEIKLGRTDYTTLVFIPDPASTDGSGKTGLNAAALTVSYTRVETDNDVVVTDATGSLSDLSALTDAHADWGLKEVSNTLAPGLYRLDIADAVFASGAWTAVVYVMITSSAAAASPMEFVLVAYDPLDTVRLGLTALPNAAADAAGGLIISDAGGLDADAQLVTKINDILTDTGTTLQAEVDGIQADTEDIQSRLGTPSDLGSGATIAANLSDIEAQTDDIGVAGAGLTVLATAANLATVAGYLDTEIAAILADTNELQTDWADGGRLDLILDARASQTSVDDLPTNAELATALGTADDAVLAQVALVKTETDKIASIKTKTDSLTFTVAGQVDANVQSINDAALTGDGSGTPWGPA